MNRSRLLSIGSSGLIGCMYIFFSISVFLCPINSSPTKNDKKEMVMTLNESTWASLKATN